MKPRIRVVSLEAENLRGYSYTQFCINRMNVLIGENNQGKSSLLKMFHRLMNVSDVDWSSLRVLSEEGYSFWYPANSQNHKARRFTINVSISDGRVARRFKIAQGVETPLRFAVRSVDGECRLNVGAPRRGEVHDSRAEDLLHLLKDQVDVVLIPPLRDAGSSTFAEKATRSVKERLKEKLHHRRQAGAPREYRIAREIVQSLKRLVNLNTEGVRGTDGSLLTGMMRANEVRLDLQPADILRLFDGSLRLYVSTGDHDEAMVQPHETGNGLQSLIDMDLSLNRSSNDEMGKETIAIIEEPEAFLHPSAQRQFMRYLRAAIGHKVGRVILTTHSPIVVDEARFEEVVVVRAQRHFQPRKADDVRASINTALMSVANSEVFFAKVVVLVEGEGDRALLSTVLRRIAAKCGSGKDLSGIVFQPTGSCKSFAPWIKLIDAFRHGDTSAFDLLWVMDGDAASRGTDRAAVRCVSESGRRFEDGHREEVVAFGDLDWGRASRVPAAVERANSALSSVGGRLFACDLEWAIFNEADRLTIESVRGALSRSGVDASGTAVELARRLGSKIEHGTTANTANKKPYIRAAIGENLPLKRLPVEIDSLIRRILLTSTGSKKRADEIMNIAAK